MPARAALEPAALRRRELARVALALERRPHDDLRAVRRELEIEARAERLVAEAELHHLRLEDHAPALEERQQIARVLAANVDADAPWALVLEAGEQADRVAVRRRMLVLGDEKRARQEGHAVLGIEERDRETAAAGAGRVPDLLHLQAVFDLLGRGRHRLRQPRIDSRSARGEAARRLRGRVGGLHGARARPLAASPLSVNAGHVHRASVHRVMHTVGRRLRGTSLRPSRLVAKRDEQGRDVLAVTTVARCESWACTAGSKAVWRELQRDAVGICVCSAHVAAGAGVFNDDVLDGVPSYVVIAAKIRSCAEQAPQRAIIQGGQGFGER